MLSLTTLESSLIKLRPMTMSDLAGFRAAGDFPQVWQHMPVNRCQDNSTATAWLSEAIDEMNQGKQLAFVTINKANNKIVGSTRLFRVNEQDKAIEIGHTFITPQYQRGYVNSHAKFLMLQYAFEVLGMVRVEICTHENNQQSRNAIARIGGIFEGVLRKNRRAPNGNYRNTALFSITDDEWPQVKENLLKTGRNEEEFYYVST
jgi:RimJ/RimL family protein N-acetyltransferase